MPQNGISAKQNRQKMIDELVHKTQFASKFEVECLLKKFKELTRGARHLMRQEFRTMLHYSFEITDDIILDRIYRVFNVANDNKMHEREFVEGMSTFLRGTLSEHIKFVHALYDLNSDGYISREEMFNLLKESLQNKGINEDDPEEGTKDLVDTILKKLDKDADGRVSLGDFTDAVTEEPLLLESLGICLPNQRLIDKFHEELLL